MTTQLDTMRDQLTDLTSDELMRLAAAVTGTLVSRFDRKPGGEPAPGHRHAMYNRYDAVRAFKQDAHAIEYGLPEL